MLWNALVSPPVLVSKGNVMIGYNPIYEYAALPDIARIVAAIERSVSTKQKKDQVAATATPPASVESIAQHPRVSSGNVQKIVVPIMGEGIRAAKIVSLLKQPGDKITYDDPLCELETDKAVYPVESSWVGVMGEWKTKVDDTVEIGQELGTILTDASEETSTPNRSNGATEKRSARAPREIEPALSPTITRKLSRVIPTNLQIEANWNAIRNARAAAKKSDGKNAASPSAMVAWAVVRAMEKHAPFRRLMLDDDQILQNDTFDLGIAVAIEGDRLATAVITTANTRDWPDFLKCYSETVEETRTGRVDAMNAPVVISSLGAFGVRTGAPIVVPPSMSTLFVGTAHKEEGVEVVTLSLTFDHRVVNGAGAASFVRDIKEGIEQFAIPKPAQATTR